MKSSIKGVLLSGLVYPGAGQVVMGRWFSGYFFIILTTAGLGLLMYRIYIRVLFILTEVIPQITPDISIMTKISSILTQAPYTSWRLESYCLSFVGCCWLAAVVHAYIVGRWQEPGNH